MSGKRFATVPVRLNQEDLDMLDALTRWSGLSRSSIMRSALVYMHREAEPEFGGQPTTKGKLLFPRKR